MCFLYLLVILMILNKILQWLCMYALSSKLCHLWNHLQLQHDDSIISVPIPATRGDSRSMDWKRPYIYSYIVCSKLFSEFTTCMPSMLYKLRQFVKMFCILLWWLVFEYCHSTSTPSTILHNVIRMAVGIGTYFISQNKAFLGNNTCIIVRTQSLPV